MKPICKFLGLVLSLLPNAALAGLIVNGGFEDPALSTTVEDGAFFVTGNPIGATGGWVAVGNSQTDVAVLNKLWDESSWGIPAFNSHAGNNALDLTGTFNRGLAAGVTQTVATIGGGSYVLSFWVGTATPSFGTDSPSFYHDPATVDLSINDGPRLHFTNTNRTLGGVNWQEFSYQFTATGTTTTVTFLNGVALGASSTSTPVDFGSWYAGLDDVGLDAVAAVPAPPALALVLTGLPGAFAATYRRRRGIVTV